MPSALSKRPTTPTAAWSTWIRILNGHLVSVAVADSHLVQDQFVPGELYHYIDRRPESSTLTVNGERYDAPWNVDLPSSTANGGRRSRSAGPCPCQSGSPNAIHRCGQSGRVAVTRGPFVLCAEGVDNGGATQRFFFENLPSSAAHAERTLDRLRLVPAGSIPAQAITESGVEQTRSSR